MTKIYELILQGIKRSLQQLKIGEELLLKAIDVPGLKDKVDVEDRLLELYSESI